MDMTIKLWSESAAFPLLTTLTLIPLLAALAVWRFKTAEMALRIGFAATLANMALSIYLLMVFDTGNFAIQLAEQFQLAGLSYSVGVDGANILFIPLTALLTLLTLVYTLITRHATDRLFIASVLVYECVLMGAFTALNVLQFWLWCVLELLPVIVLTLCAGTGQYRQRAIRYVLQYWVSGLLMTLCGFLLLAFGLIDSEHNLTFDWLTLKQNSVYLHDETLIFILLFYGFAIRMPLFPFHGWLPVLAEQGTVASAFVFLVGLKLGVYAVIRFILPMIPGVAEQWANFVLILGLLSVFYGAILALMQINIRRLLAFAVISHTGMLIIGVFCFNDYGLEGTLLLSVSYGLATAGMLFSSGLIYERTRTSFLPRLGGLFDSHAHLAFLFMISALTTMVMPGTPGFDAAHLLIEGVIEEDGWLIAIGILIGNVLAAAFLLWAFQRIFFATPKRAYHPAHSKQHPVRTERIIAGIICTALIGTGFYTTPWLNFIDQEAVAMHEQYPVHGAPQSAPMLAPDSDDTLEKDDTP
ncbi:Proton-translocating NADH-quinone oxidoreductase, chain M [Crenothrix polyspora]|uniref:NADH-quinone oxidoreductase subunit M n=2 Tax=Crenothrix polyspora TaxID=360316 RepID=A0A1R4H645_9GAMM|nr:NADH-quinone oxidoreductase subunit M [Crenothrix polyspora]SJM91704.1 Proton-translocating NADH-quinone oxidoreductase, chain M [Crenothrix polyspora]